MADLWKSYVDLDGAHIVVAANSPATVAELLELRGVHRAHIVQPCGREPQLLAELIDETWQLADFAARHELVPRVADLQGRLDAAKAVLDRPWPDDEDHHDFVNQQVEDARAALRGVPRG